MLRVDRSGQSERYRHQREQNITGNADARRKRIKTFFRTGMLLNLLACICIQPKVRCDPYPLTHGDEVKMGETVLSFHIHTGTSTCDGCEPGQIIAHLSRHKREENTGTITHGIPRLVLL